MTPIEQYLDALDRITGDPNPKFIQSPFLEGPKPPVFAVTYKNFPAPGLMTCITSGLSFAEHDEWVSYKPELLLTVQSSDEAWPLALAFTAHQGRGKYAFLINDTIDFRAQISTESQMSGFFICEQTLFEKNKHVIHMPSGHIVLHQLIPIYAGELGKIRAVDRNWLYAKEFDPYDVTRKDESL
jgi:hypothetical protein